MQQNSVPLIQNKTLVPLEDAHTAFCKSDACHELLLSCFEGIVPAFGDWCVVELCTREESLRDPWIFHRSHHELDESGVANLLSLNHLWEATEAEHSSCADGSFLHQLAKSPEQLEKLQSLNLDSYVSVPLISPRHLWGWLTIFRVQGQTTITSGDVAKVKALAQASAAALDIAAEKAKTDAIIENKNKFVSMIAHELRAPLNITMGWSGLLIDDPNVDDEVKKTLQIIYRNTREQADLINNLLDSTRLELGKLRLELKNIHLATFVEQNLQAVAVLANDKGVHLRSQVNAPFARLMADPVRLHQILQNLVVNAIKFTPRNGSVSVNLNETPSHVVLEVKDTGEGIAKDFVPQVFERFKQRINKKSYQPGLGLGLSIVRELVSAHGGEVSAYSEGLGKGSTFIVQFPKQISMEAVSPEAGFFH